MVFIFAFLILVWCGVYKIIEIQFRYLSHVSVSAAFCFCCQFIVSTNILGDKLNSHCNYNWFFGKISSCMCLE